LTSVVSSAKVMIVCIEPYTKQKHPQQNGNIHEKTEETQCADIPTVEVGIVPHFVFLSGKHIDFCCFLEQKSCHEAFCIVEQKPEYQNRNNAIY